MNNMIHMREMKNNERDMAIVAMKENESSNFVGDQLNAKTNLNYNKEEVISAVKQNTRILHTVLLLIVSILLLVNTKYLSSLLDYIPLKSIAILLVIVIGLVLGVVYLIKKISNTAMAKLVEYSETIDTLLLAKQQEIIERNKAQHKLKIANDNLENKVEERTAELSNAKTLLAKEHKELTQLFRTVSIAKTEWEKTMDCVADMVMLTDSHGVIKRLNKSLMDFVNKPYTDIIGERWEKIMRDNKLETISLFDEDGAGEIIEVTQKPTDKWFELISYPYKDETLDFSGFVITLHETTEIRRVSRELEASHAQILQGEKMASIGQLAAGVAHEINNPTGFVLSNLNTLEKYASRLTEFINDQSKAIESPTDGCIQELAEKKKTMKIDYIHDDIKDLISESIDGADRIKNIVQNLKSFARVDESDLMMADINECIESTLNIVWNELKYKSEVFKDYGTLPLINCYPQQLNQVFMNLLINASQSIEKQGEIRIKTWNGDGMIHVSISDTGAGIPEDKMNRIFEPFFTTKAVGMGTGLGLSISYDIVKKHNGEIKVDSEVGKGTTFNVTIPFMQGK